MRRDFNSFFYCLYFYDCVFLEWTDGHGIEVVAC